MPYGVELPSDFPPDPALIDALCAETAPAVRLRRLRRLRRLAQLRQRVKKGHTFLREQADNLDQLYEEIAKASGDAEDLDRIAVVVLEKRRAAAERLSPGIETLRRKLAARGDRLDPKIRQPFEESVDIAAGWLALYDGLYQRLLELASARRITAGVRRARPIAGEADYAELTRETVARFPKILAALAK
jgi:hypothetical protein